MEEPNETSHLNTEMVDKVLVIELNRPESMNALSPDLVDDLHRTLDEADADDAVRAIVLTGAGKAFSSGFDMGRARQAPKNRDELLAARYQSNIDGVERLLSIMELSKPVIAAVNGWCMGGGFWYALACDITIAGESAVFAQPEVRHISNGSFLLAAAMGWKNAHRYGLTGDHFDAQEALRIGVVNEVVPDDELMDTALALGHRLSLVPRASVRYNKAVTNLGLQMAGLRNAMTLNAALSTLVMASNDADDAEHIQEARAHGMREFLKVRDEPFRPEPFGPKSKPRPTDA